MSNKYEYVKKSTQERKEWVYSLKDGPCLRCGLKFHPSAMQFHHRDPKTKRFGIGRGCYRNSRKLILEEIAKCDLLCANCHAIIHFEKSGICDIQQVAD